MAAERFGTDCTDNVADCNNSHIFTLSGNKADFFVHFINGALGNSFCLFCAFAVAILKICFFGKISGIVFADGSKMFRNGFADSFFEIAVAFSFKFTDGEHYGLLLGNHAPHGKVV